MSVPKKIHLYRMVHWQNIATILQNGLCCKNHPNADANYINIGHQQLILDRHTYPIPFKNSGTLGEYIPFYFGGHSPMLYLINNGYQGVQQLPQEDIVFIVSTFTKIKETGLEFVFTDRNAKLSLANYYQSEKDLDKIQWNIVKSKYWRNDETNVARQDYKQAEFLVRNYIPVSCITAIVVKTEQRRLFFINLAKELGIELEVHRDDNSKLFY